MQRSSNERQTSQKLKRIKSKLIYLNRQQSRMKDIERKQDTRRKIQLGGLVKKAGLEHESTAILYGLLLEAAEKLKSEDAKTHRDSWHIRGDLALTFDGS